MIKLFNNYLKRLVKRLYSLIFFPLESQPKYVPNYEYYDLEKEIPNVVYQTWVSRFIPRKLANSIIKFRSINKDHSFFIFDDTERDQYMKNKWSNHPIYEIYINSIFQASKSDIFRYCIIYEKGGFYFDIKSGCETPLSQLKSSNGAILSYENTILSYPLDIELIECSNYPFNIIKNWGFGFKRKHPLLECLINEIIKYAPLYRNYLFSNPKNAILAFTGPGMMTKVYRKYNYNKKEIIFPLGIDFNNKGIYELNGSDLRFRDSISYTKFKNSIILK